MQLGRVPSLGMQNKPAQTGTHLNYAKLAPEPKMGPHGVQRIKSAVCCCVPMQKPSSYLNFFKVSHMTTVNLKLILLGVHVILIYRVGIPRGLNGENNSLCKER